ncbi:MAG: hypothetical protein DRQ13_09705 [Ignavibacteriae bacterium]|nr:MAG: hypothetical protein DRQ13_09705 [Ignavibacteriota bacterium]
MKLFIISVLLSASTLQAQSQFRFYINYINMPMDNKGILADVDIPPVGSGGRYHDIGFLYSGGFWLSGYNGDTLWANGQATISPFRDYIPGNVDSNQHDPRYKVYTISMYYPPFSSDWQEWKTAVNFGADFYDGDGDGIYNPVDLNNNGQWDPEEDSPDIIGDQIAWCVFNDGDTTRPFDRSSPLGIEIHQTLFGYHSYLAPQLQNVLFIRYKIFNTGKVNSKLDSVYFSAWTDPDLGDYLDDLVGCDTLSNSGYVYNSGPDWMFGHEPPAFFINMLQGPQAYIPGETFIDNNFNGTFEDSIDTPLDTAYNHQGPLKGFQLFPGAKNQKMSAFTHYYRNSLSYGEYEARNYMLGKNRDGNLLDPCTWIYGDVRGGVDCNLVNPLYWYSGDPENDYGWINNNAYGQRMLVHTGPFSLEVDKPITIIVGYTIGQGDSPLNSVTVGKEVSAFVQQFYQSNFDDNILPVEEEKYLIVDEFKLFQNYPNPFNPTTIIRFTIPTSPLNPSPYQGEGQRERFITLIVYDVLGNEIAILVNEEKPSGNFEVVFDASSLPSGVYFYQLKAGDFIQSNKMILLK